MSKSHSISDRFDSTLKIAGNKSDAKSFDQTDSPVSPLRAGAAATAATSSSSSSSGSFTGKPLPNAAPFAAASEDLSRRNLSGELSGLSYGSPNRRPGHRRSGSGQLLFSGTVNSPAANVLPAGNICPSGRIGKSGMMSRSAARSDVLGSGSANYGHGSIMRGGVGGAGSEVRSLRPVKVDPEEVTKLGNEHYKKGQFGDAVKYYDRAVEICPANAACWSNRAAALIGLGRLGEAVRDCEEAIRLNPSYYKVHHRLGCLHLR